MAFPTSPTNGQAYTLNGKTYVWSSANGVWVVSTATSQIPTFLATSGGTITGNLAVTGNVTVGNLTATALTGQIQTPGQPLITSLGNLLGLTVSGNILSTNLTIGGTIGSVSNGNIVISPNGTGLVVSTANLLPNANATINLGNATLRWATVFTTDLELSNGIGDYTIVEGEDDLFLYNNKKGKVYKFVIQEVDPKDAPPKAGAK